MCLSISYLSQLGPALAPGKVVICFFCLIVMPMFIFGVYFSGLWHTASQNLSIMYSVMYFKLKEKGEICLSFFSIL